MNGEIEARLSKARQIEQGMMHELLVATLSEAVRKWISDAASMLP